MENAAPAPSCSVSGSQRRDRAADADADSANQQAAGAQQQPEHDMFGDWNLNTVMMFMLLLHFMQYAMRQPCGC
ncbi:DNA primase, UL52/UL70 type, Herpesviridae [Phytophthora cinnamomi]|uniref:DNA primase, UL52/UL70 type, Herpesviridae n=1 Tax=Phytophthora cinnamomi TaxID=4785 RepID=UPI00355A0DD4|nr:DNA primase, UL52/UL70 type, Herpesviridae [Phytophthora cinnamomi]